MATAIQHPSDFEIDEAIHLIRRQRAWKLGGAIAILVGVLATFIGGTAHMLNERHGAVVGDGSQGLVAPPADAAHE